MPPSAPRRRRLDAAPAVPEFHDPPKPTDAEWFEPMLRGGQLYAVRGPEARFCGLVVLPALGSTDQPYRPTAPDWAIARSRWREILCELCGTATGYRNWAAPPGTDQRAAAARHAAFYCPPPCCKVQQQRTYACEFSAVCPFCWARNALPHWRRLDAALFGGPWDGRERADADLVVRTLRFNFPTDHYDPEALMQAMQRRLRQRPPRYEQRWLRALGMQQRIGFEIEPRAKAWLAYHRWRPVYRQIWILPPGQPLPQPGDRHYDWFTAAGAAKITHVQQPTRATVLQLAAQQHRYPVSYLRSAASLSDILTFHANLRLIVNLGCCRRPATQESEMKATKAKSKSTPATKQASSAAQNGAAKPAAAAPAPQPATLTELFEAHGCTPAQVCEILRAFVVCRPNLPNLTAFEFCENLLAEDYVAHLPAAILEEFGPHYGVGDEVLLQSYAELLIDQPDLRLADFLAENLVERPLVEDVGVAEEEVEEETDEFLEDGAEEVEEALADDEADVDLDDQEAAEPAHTAAEAVVEDEELAVRVGCQVCCRIGRKVINGEVTHVSADGAAIRVKDAAGKTHANIPVETATVTGVKEVEAPAPAPPAPTNPVLRVSKESVDTISRWLKLNKPVTKVGKEEFGPTDPIRQVPLELADGLEAQLVIYNDPTGPVLVPELVRHTVEVDENGVEQALEYPVCNMPACRRLLGAHTFEFTDQAGKRQTLTIEVEVDQ